MVGPNLGLSNIISDVIEQVTNEADVEELCSKSTEGILYKVENYNKTIKDKPYIKKKVLASMDVVKLYNKLEKEEAAKIVGKMVTESSIKFEGIDVDKLALYLGNNLEDLKMLYIKRK